MIKKKGEIGRMETVLNSIVLCVDLKYVLGWEGLGREGGSGGYFYFSKIKKNKRVVRMM